MDNINNKSSEDYKICENPIDIPPEIVVNLDNTDFSSEPKMMFPGSSIISVSVSDMNLPSFTGPYRS